MKKTLSTLLLLLMFSAVSEAQVYYLFGQRAYNEIGFSLSSGLIRGDWLDNSEPSDIFGLGGFGVGFVHRAHQARGRFGLRSNVSYSMKKHNHTPDGLQDAGFNPGNGFEQAAAMEGTSNLFQIGSRVEFNIVDFGPYERRNVVSPYVGAGINLIYSTNSVKAPQGLPDFYAADGRIEESGFSPSVQFAGGLRFKVSRTSYLNLYYEFDYLFLDSIDGLNPEVKGDTSSDYMHNIGVSMLWAIF